ncbi:MAG TPA: hypothetical protein DEH78_06335, partial [Solibacterales bacterium]|nr:hypothetical protein [Bryobacterales bacterium]
MKLFLFLLLPLTLAAQSWTHALSSLDGLKTAGAKAEAVTYKGKPAVRITAAAADGNVIPVAGPP